MSTWLDNPGDYAESTARDAESALCAPELGPCPDCGEPVPLPAGWSDGYGPLCTPCSLAAEREQ